MVTGREVRLPADIIYADPSPGSSTETRNVPTMQQARYAGRMPKRLVHVHQIAMEQLKQRAKCSKVHYDQKASVIDYNVGDPVWCLIEGRNVGLCPKLENIYEGPMLIQQKKINS
ncbi:hypothetical protein DPMN_165564 [Dreissena polymorpha]|uniref:Uncharacterized protein n=1 Tax=Dreissena polymorpha TaxID=45954 RepID=A0A9D4F0I4_DREPO|nr:hypothetical protein DPMN_165564 [Dreissena polymorpha]